jgi:hypothetical protein
VPKKKKKFYKQMLCIWVGLKTCYNILNLFWIYSDVARFCKNHVGYYITMNALLTLTLAELLSSSGFLFILWSLFSYPVTLSNLSGVSCNCYIEVREISAKQQHFYSWCLQFLFTL